MNGGFGPPRYVPARISASVNPVGLGTYLAWVHHDWTSQSKGVGFATAVAAAQAGAWLGFHATTGLIALVTAILGAIAGANLVLILLDMMWARSARDRAATGTAAGTRSTDIELEASTGAGRR